MSAPVVVPAPAESVRTFEDDRWDDGPSRGLEALLESGHVLCFPSLGFALDDGERRFLDPGWSHPSAKNVSLRWPTGELRGAVGNAPDLAALRGLLLRYTEATEALAMRLFPHYRGRLRRGNVSLRPTDVAGRAGSWRQDDTRLHVDAFPSNPMHGVRLLRVFSNVNPHGRARSWRVGEPFEAHARRYLGAMTPPRPGLSWLMATTGITKQRRSRYDHHMLQLHDRAKADADFQATGPQVRIDFAPGTTWVCFSDQVLHAATGGQHLLEQTLYLPPDALRHPESSPLATLERMLGRRLAS